MMLWAHWIELYCAAVAELLADNRLPPVVAPSATVFDLSEERAKRRRTAVRGS